MVAGLGELARRPFRQARKPPALGAPRRGYPVLADAPGAYVLEKEE